MSEELFEILNEHGEPLGLAPRTQAHREGLWHRAVHVFVFRADGRLVIQRRQLDKDICPGAWDLSAAEHLKPGESYLDGAMRGLREELGVTAHVELELIGGTATARLELPERGIKDYEFQQSFRCLYEGPLTADPEEVADLQAVTLGDLAAAFASRPDDFTPWFREDAMRLGLVRG